MSFKLWFSNEPLYVSKFGILEPHKSNKEIIPDLIMVPLVAFDKQLNRIGYGGGFYDRFLQTCPQALTVGLAFENQIVGQLPTQAWDHPVDLVLTEQRII